MEYFSNPLVLGLIAAIVIYVLLYYIEKRNDEKEINHKKIIIRSGVGGVVIALMTYIIKEYTKPLPSKISSEEINLMKQEGGAFSMSSESEVSIPSSSSSSSASSASTASSTSTASGSIKSSHSSVKEILGGSVMPETGEIITEPADF